jgi:hypothetical protein
MAKKESKNPFENLPVCAADYIRLVIKKMRWQKKARQDVQAELIAHFEDALRNCKTDEEKERKAKEIIDNFGDAKMLAILARRAKKRCRPLWQKTVIKAFQTFGIIIGLFIIYLIWFLSGKPNITTDYLAELNQMVRPADVNDSQNAAVYYNQAAEKIKNMPEGLKDIFAKSYYECNEPEKKQGQDWLAKNQDVFNLVSSGSEKPYYWRKYEAENNELLSILMPYLHGYRRISTMLCWQGCFSVQQGNYHQALEDIMTTYRFGKHLRAGFSLVEQLVAIAIESVATRNVRDILSRYPIDSAELAKLSGDMQTIIQDEDFRINFEGEKLFMYDEIQRCFTDDFIGSGHIYPRRLLDLIGDFTGDEKETKLVKYLYITYKSLLTQPNRNETVKKVDRFYDYYNKMADMSLVQQRLHREDIEKEIEEIIGNNLLIAIMKPAFLKVIELGYRNKADVHATLTVIAAIRYKQDRGDWPDSLEQLFEKGYLKEIPIDPYSDEPLVYKKTENDFLLYSFGSDFDDDGGKIGLTEKGKPNMWNAEDGDAVFWPVATP